MFFLLGATYKFSYVVFPPAYWAVHHHHLSTLQQGKLDVLPPYLSYLITSIFCDHLILNGYNIIRQCSTQKSLRFTMFAKKNIWRSKACLLSLLVDIANKKIHPKGVDIIFLTEPPCVTSNNKLSNVPNNREVR